MRSIVLLLAASTLTTTTLSAASLAQRIEHIIDSSPIIDQAFFGIEILDLETGKTLYSKNANHLLIPASNTKLFTTALALTRLGPDYHYITRVLASTAPDADGCLHGDLILKGAGDPSLSGRVIPYYKDAPPGEPLRALEELADQVIAHGVRRIGGDIIGDDTAYIWEPYPPGWSEEDTVWDYGAPVSALSIDDNFIQLSLRPGDLEGDPPHLTLDPPLPYYWIDNRAVTSAAETKIDVDRGPGSPQLLLSGTISHPVTEAVAINDPARFAACALADALTRRGVVIDGRPRAHHRLPTDGPAAPNPPITLASRTSPPLAQLLQVTDKVSENLYAELFLREVGHGQRREGLDAMKAFLADAAIDAGDTNFEDGSGLSRLTLVTPHAIAQLLAWMYRSPNRDTWISLLPIGGYDGSLAHRFQAQAIAQVIHAKTGSLSHVNSLSGYVLQPEHHAVVFSIAVNNTISANNSGSVYHSSGPPTEVRQFIDKIALAITK